MTAPHDGREHPPALILGSGVTALGVVRSLGRAGIPQYVWSRPDDLALKSRWARRLPGAEGDGAVPEDLAGTLADLALEQAVLIPCSDAAALAIAQLPDDLAGRFPASVCRPDILATLMDKEGLADLLRPHGIPHPRTHFLKSAEDLETLPDDAFQRAFLKPRDSQRFFRTFGRKAFRVEDREDSLVRYREIRSHGLETILQEYVPGPASSHIFLDGFRDRHGQVRHLFARRRLRMHPPDFGNSTLMVSVPVREVQPAAENLERLLEATDYRGIFSAEFKQDERDGTFRLLEVNCRAWWYIEFADRCGAHIAAAAYRDALALPLGREKAPRAGVRCVYPDYDLDAFRYQRGGDGISWWRWFWPWLGAQDVIFVLDDPVPALSILRQRFARLFSRTTSKLRRNPSSGSGTPARVLVLDGDQVATLAVVRSLAREGHLVTVGAPGQNSPAFRSRYADERFVYPDPMLDAGEFRGQISRRVTEGSYDLVIPVTDRTIVPLMTIREELERHAVLAMASNEALDVVLSKTRTTKLAESLGVPVPRSVSIEEGDAGSLVPWESDFPVVVKPDRSKVWASEDGATESGQALAVEYAVNDEDLRTRASTLLESTDVLLQEAVSGVGVGLAVLAREGELLHVFQYRRLHEVPLTGGASSYRVSERLDPGLLEKVRTMVRELRWDGVAMFEFKRDPSGPGRYWLMEVNGRFWGSLPLPVAAGADFPRFLLESLLRGRRDFPRDYRIGLRVRNLKREVGWWKSILKRAPDPTGLVRYPSPGRILLDAVRMLNPLERWDTLVLSDPAPFLAEVFSVVTRNVATIGERLRIGRVRRGMARHRRRPRDLRRALEKTDQIHFVCHGNIIRSAYSEARLRSDLSSDGGVTISSSGLAAIPGRPADPRAVRVARERSIDLKDHRAAGFGETDVRPGAVIIAMEAKHVIELRRRLNSRSVHVYLLGCLASDGDIEIPDPFMSRRIEEFGIRFDQIDQAVGQMRTILENRDPARPVVGA